MSGESAALVRKIRRAAQLLLIQRHRTPGAKGWELRKALGRSYLEVLKALDKELEPLGLAIKIVFEEEGEEDPDRARFLVVPREPVAYSDLVRLGWRIDDLGALTACVAYLLARGGRAGRREVEELLAEKLPHWRIDRLIDRFVRMGYLVKEGEGVLAIGWRSKAEIDFDLLRRRLLFGEESS